MKSKVILFCVLLFCFKIVDSIPHAEDHVRQRVNPLSNWQVNQNVPNTQYLDTDFTQTRNVNIQPEKTQDFYPNQGRRHNYDSTVNNRSPASSSSGEDLLVRYDSPADGLRLDSYPSRVESYPSRTSQVGFDSQQYRNENWRPQNQYTKPARSAVLIPDDERLLVTTVQEPYRGPLQYLHPKYVPPTNRRFYQPGRTYLTREQVQYPLTGERKYVANSAPRFGLSGPVPYETYGEDEVAASKIKARPTGGRRYAQSIVPQSGIIYNEAPAIIAADTLTDQSENIEFAENYRSRSVLSNSAPIKNQDIRSPLISEPDNNSDSIPSLAHINTKKDAPVIISKILSEKPLARRYAINYRSDSGWSNNVGDASYNGAPVVNEPVEVKSGKYEANYGPKEPVPINTYSGASSAPSDTVLVNSGNNKREESNVAHHGSSSPTPTNTNPKLNLYPTISSEGITEYNLSSFVAKPEIQDILARTNKRYVVVHSNGTVEFLDTIDLGSPQNSKLRLVHHKRKNIESSDSDGVLTQQSPENLPNNVAKTPLSVDEYPLPTNNQPADDKKPSPLKVDQAKQADEYDSNLWKGPLKDLPPNYSNLKPSPQPEKKPADNNNYKLLPSSSTSNEDQSTQNDNLKPLPQGVNQPRDDDDSKTLTAHVNQSAGDGNYKPLPLDGNKPANQKNQSAKDDNLKLLTSKEHQPAVDHNSKPDQTNDENNFFPLFPNARQPAHVIKPKNSYVKHPANDNNSDPLNENRPQDNKPFHPYRRHSAHHHKSKHSHVNQPADNNNSHLSSPGESQPANDSNSWPSNEDQSGGETDSTSLLSHKKHPVHRYKPKLRHSHNQSEDDNPSLTPKLLTYPENQPGGDKKSNPSSPGENQPASDNNSWPSNEYQSGDETDFTSLLSQKKHPVHRYKPKSRHSHIQSADDNPSTTPKLLTYPENQPGGDKKSNPSSPGEIKPANDNNSWPSNEYQSRDETDSTSLLSHKKQPSQHYKPKSIQSHDQPADDNPSTTPKLLTYPKNQPGGDKSSNPSSPNENAPENNDNSKPLPSNEHQSGDETNYTSLSSHKKQPPHHYKPKSIQSYDLPADDNPSTTPKLLTYPKNQSEGDKNSNPSSPNENAPENNDNSKPLPSNEHQSGDETDSTSLTSHKKQPSHHYKPKPIQSQDQPADDNPSTTPKLLTYPKNQPGDDKSSNPSSPNENAPENNDNSKPLPSNEHQSGDETDSISLPSHKRQPSHHYKPKSIQSHEQPADDNPSTTPKLLAYPKNQPGGDKSSNPSSPNENAPENKDNYKPLPSNEHQSGDETDSTSLPSHKKQPSHHYKPKSIQSHDQPADDNTSTTPKLLTYPKNQPGDDKSSNPSSPNENAPENNDNYKPLPSNEHQSGDETDFTSLPSHKKQPSQHYIPKSIQSHDQPADDNPSTTPKLLTYPKNQPGGDKSSNPSSPNENAPENKDNYKPLPSNEHQSGDETDSTSLPSHKKQPSQHYKPKSIQSHDQPAVDNNSNPSFTPLLNYPENQPGDYDNSNPSSPSEDQTEDDNTSEPLPSNENQSGDGNDSESLRKNKRQPANDDEEQPGDNNDSEPLPAHATQSANNTKSKPSHGAQPGNDNNSNPSSPDENQPDEDKKSKPLQPNENQPTDDLKTKPTTADASKTDDQSNSTTVFRTEPNHTTSSKPQVIKTHKRKHIHRTSTTSSPVGSTTPCPDDTSEDQIITLSPIEQTTDNVIDVPPVTTTTTTTRPVKTPGKSNNDANIIQDDAQDDIAQIYSTTTVSPSTSTSPTDDVSDDKTKGINEVAITQAKEKIDVDQVNNREKDTQTAVYSSSELFDTNTDVPAESDDYSSVTASPSVQNDVDKGDNALELEQSETDVTITVSSSKPNDSEDEMININIEVSESTDDADSSSTDKSLLVSVDTNDGNNDDSKTPKPEDCKKDNNNDGRVKNVKIDVSNLKGEPTMWIRTTNQDYVDKLTAKNDTKFDLIYFFHIDNQPAIEREKTTTIHCNGTVVTEIIEITYANKDDLTPTIVKTTKIMDFEDYKADEV